MKTVLGIDLGINLGLAWGDKKAPEGKLGSVCRKTATQTIGMSMEHKITRVCKDYGIDIVGVEKLNFSTNTLATQAHGKYYESVKRVCLSLGLQLIDVTPGEAKKALTGKGNASKHAMCHFASKLYGMDILDDNIADAIGVYVATRNKLRL